MSQKKFRLQADQIRPIATNRGSCIATDMITVDGRRLGFMYRESPNDDLDSGWRFMPGTESPEYIDNPANHEVYDVNTIAKYEPELIPYLDSPSGAAFARDCVTNRFIEVDAPSPDY